MNRHGKQLNAKSLIVEYEEFISNVLKGAGVDHDVADMFTIDNSVGNTLRSNKDDVGLYNKLDVSDDDYLNYMTHDNDVVPNFDKHRTAELVTPLPDAPKDFDNFALAGKNCLNFISSIKRLVILPSFNYGKLFVNTKISDTLAKEANMLLWDMHSHIFDNINMFKDYLKRKNLPDYESSRSKIDDSMKKYVEYTLYSNFNKLYNKFLRFRKLYADFVIDNLSKESSTIDIKKANLVNSFIKVFLLMGEMQQQLLSDYTVSSLFSKPIDLVSYLVEYEWYNSDNEHE